MALTGMLITTTTTTTTTTLEEIYNNMVFVRKILNIQKKENCTAGDMVEMGDLVMEIQRIKTYQE